MPADPSNHLFELAVRFVHQTNRDLFLTGKAGTGKTTFLKYLKETSLKKMVVVAPTGVAAINAGGVTMHSFFQLPFGPFIPVQRREWNDQLTVTDPHSLFKGIRFNYEKRELIRELELLVIDEVSMLRADMLDAVDLILRHFRENPIKPFGGVQVVYIGDLFQLPPVIRNDEWSILKEYYKSPFFFDALVIHQSPPLFLELKKIYRQSEQEFIDILNNIRNNCADAGDLEKLHKQYHPGYRPEQGDHYITLTTHNVKADAMNRESLDALPGKTFIYEAKVEGDFSDKALPADRILQLKEGAQVMFIRNDKGENRRYFNGRIATISRIAKENLYVVFPGEKKELELEKEIWRNIRYSFNAKKNTIEEDELGTFTQYPVRLAWAITIHKSQGLTFEKAIIDAGEAFAPGQVYVALSRLTKLNGLILYSRIYPGCIATDERVVTFSGLQKAHDELTTLLAQEQESYVQGLLIKAFNWLPLTVAMTRHIESYEERMIPAREEALAWAKALSEKVRQEQEVAVKFIRQLKQLVEEVQEHGYKKVFDRMTSASVYFFKKLNECSLDVEAHISAYKVKQKVKKYVEDCRRLLLVIDRKKQDLQHALELSEGLIKGGSLSGFLDEIGIKRKPEAEGEKQGAEEKIKKEPSRNITLDLFREGKSLADIARIRGFTMSTITGHLADFISTGEVKIVDLVAPERMEMIMKTMDTAKESEGNGFVKASLPDDFSYSEIMAVRAYRKLLAQGGEVSVQNKIGISSD